MRRWTNHKLVWAAWVAVALCGAFAASWPSRGAVAPDRSGRPTVIKTARYTPPRWVRLLTPLPRPGEQPEASSAPPRPTPEQQAAAAMRVTAGNLARALSQAAAAGDERTVANLLQGLPRYGEAAREKIEEELARTKNPKSREALTRALAD